MYFKSFNKVYSNCDFKYSRKISRILRWADIVLLTNIDGVRVKVSNCSEGVILKDRTNLSDTREGFESIDFEVVEESEVLNYKKEYFNNKRVCIVIKKYWEEDESIIRNTDIVEDVVARSTGVDESSAKLDSIYSAKGKVYLRYCASVGIDMRTYEKEELLKEVGGIDIFKKFDVAIYTLMSGLEFLEDVDSGGLIDYDGNIANIFVDGYISNVGLAHKGIMQGDFMMNDEAFKELCERHKVEVNWANR